MEAGSKSLVLTRTLRARQGIGMVEHGIHVSSVGNKKQQFFCQNGTKTALSKEPGESPVEPLSI
jgi:hypothetical protein